ncbi:hypothetical protein [Neobacillus sp. YIM B06451]|uniref:hypothetical protein n=1 Tax=Neobacillus sp. YIM B06451 TaxID=3070994 RepID=UPI00292E0083|nr:hypothetical protein [Neobacillus sp. YIM B06451]
MGIEELKKVDLRENNYEHEITTKYHSNQNAIQTFYNLKFRDAVEFNIVLSFDQQSLAIDYLLKRCPLFLIYNQASNDPIADIKSFAKYSGLFDGTTILSLPEQVLNDIKKFKDIFLSN